MLSLFRSGCSFNYIRSIVNKISLFFVSNTLFVLAISFSELVSSAPQASLAIVPDELDVVGQDVVVLAQRDDTLVDLSLRYGLGRLELQWANPSVDPWKLAPTQHLTLPLRWILPQHPRRGIVINLPELRLYHFEQQIAGATSLASYPVSIGRLDWQTPLGQLKIVERLKAPDWRPTESVRQHSSDRGIELPPLVLPGPLNPLGQFALRLSKRRYLIHGTNKPAGIGMRVSHGCIRLYPEDIKALFGNAKIDGEVSIINQPIKVGRSGDQMFVEVHPPLEETPVDDAQLVRQALRLLKVRVKDINKVNVGPELSIQLNPDSLLRAIKQKHGRPTLVAMLRSGSPKRPAP